MAERLGEQAFYLPAADEWAFCVAHAADVPESGIGAVLSPPFGWEDTASYRARRSLALRLSDRGHRVIRILPPGTGDSSGSPTDSRHLDVWCRPACSRASCCGWVGRETAVP